MELSMQEKKAVSREEVSESQEERERADTG